MNKICLISLILRASPWRMGTSSCSKTKARPRRLKVPRCLICMCVLCCTFQGANAFQSEPEKSSVHQQFVLHVSGLTHYTQALPEWDLVMGGGFASRMVGMIILLGSVLQRCFCFVDAVQILQTWLAKPVRSPGACRKVRNRRFGWPRKRWRHRHTAR